MTEPGYRYSLLRYVPGFKMTAMEVDWSPRGHQSVTLGIENSAERDFVHLALLQVDGFRNRRTLRTLRHMRTLQTAYDPPRQITLNHEQGFAVMGEAEFFQALMPDSHMGATAVRIAQVLEPFVPLENTP